MALLPNVARRSGAAGPVSRARDLESHQSPAKSRALDIAFRSITAFNGGGTTAPTKSLFEPRYAAWIIAGVQETTAIAGQMCFCSNHPSDFRGFRHSRRTLCVSRDQLRQENCRLRLQLMKSRAYDSAIAGGITKVPTLSRAFTRANIAYAPRPAPMAVAADFQASDQNCATRRRLW